MIDLRYTFIFVFILISNLLIAPVNSAVKIEDRQYNPINNKTDFKLDSVIQKNEIRLIVSNQTQNIELPKKIKNNLSVLGIVITSILFLTILRLLFKEEKLAKSQTNKNETSINIIERDNQLNETNKTRINSKLVKTKIANKADSNHDSKYAKQVPRFEQSKIINPEMNIAQVNTPKTEKFNREGIVDSDVMGKLTIVTSSTTEIDVVFELIKDLQQNSNPQDLVRQKELRRKAIWELSQTNDFRAIQPLVQTIPKVDSLEKNLILDAIAQIANHSFETINNIFITSLEDESGEVRKNAIQDLTTLYHSMFLITAHLSKMTSDSDQEVQHTAKCALKQFQQMSIPVSSVQHTDKNK